MGSSEGLAPRIELWSNGFGLPAPAPPHPDRARATESDSGRIIEESEFIYMILQSYLMVPIRGDGALAPETPARPNRYLFYSATVGFVHQRDDLFVRSVMGK